MSRHVASVVSVFDTDVRIYESDHWDHPHQPTHYYWCCKTCGACSKPIFGMDNAVSSATQHNHNDQEQSNADDH